MLEPTLVLRRAAGASAEPMKPTRPVLALAKSNRTWDGAVWERETQRLFLPSSAALALGDELALQVIDTASPAPGCRGRVVEVWQPGGRGPGSPAGFTLQLIEPDPLLMGALERLAPPRDGARRSAPRFTVEAPVVVRPCGPKGQPVARIEYITDQELAADYVSNLSQGGAFVRSAQPLPIGSSVFLEMRLPGGTVLEAPATVAHVTAAGMGVQFHLDEAGEKALGEVIARISAHQRHALVVDDDALARRVIAGALAARGFSVFSASDGVSGLGVLTDEILALDLLVADLRMPGMDGESFLNTIRSAGGEQDLTVVLVSATVDPFVEARLLGAGADAVLDKALGPELIAAASDAALERRQLVRSSQ